MNERTHTEIAACHGAGPIVKVGARRGYANPASIPVSKVWVLYAALSNA